jgi:hypothetical protein
MSPLFPLFTGGGALQIIHFVIPGRAKREPGISRFRVQPFGLPRNDSA